MRSGDRGVKVEGIKIHRDPGTIFECHARRSLFGNAYALRLTIRKNEEHSEYFGEPREQERSGLWRLVNVTHTAVAFRAGQRFRIWFAPNECKTNGTTVTEKPRTHYDVVYNGTFTSVHLDGICSPWNDAYGTLKGVLTIEDANLIHMKKLLFRSLLDLGAPEESSNTQTLWTIQSLYDLAILYGHFRTRGSWKHLASHLGFLPSEVEELECALQETSTTEPTSPVTPKRAFCLLFHCYRRQGGCLARFVCSLRKADRSDSLDVGSVISHPGNHYALAESVQSNTSCLGEHGKSCPLAGRLGTCEEKKNTPSHSNDRRQNGGSVNEQTIVSTSQCENEPKPANRTWLREARRRRTSVVPAEPSIATINPDDYTQPDMRTPIKRTKHDDDTSVTESETVGFRAKKARLSELQTELTVKNGSYETTKKVRTRPKAKNIRRVDAFKSIKQSLLPDLWHPGLKHQNYSPSILLNTVQTRLEETRRQTVEFQRNLVELRKKFDYSCRQLNIPVHPNIHAEDDSAIHTVLTDLKLWHLSSMFDQPFAPNWKTLSVICNISSQLGCESSVCEELIEQIDRLAGSDSRVSVYLVLLFWLERCSNPIISEKPPTLECLLDQLRISGYEKFASFCVTHINDTKPW